MKELLPQFGVTVDWRLMMTFAGLILTRLVMVMTTIPFLTGKPVPAQIKIGIAVTLMFFLYPFLSSQAGSLPKENLALLALFLKEAFYGMLIGFAAGIAFHGFEAAGNVIDNQRGAAQARLLIPQLGEQSSLFGNFFFQFSIVLFLISGGHRLFLATLVESYRLLPILDFPQRSPDLLLMADQIILMTGKVLIVAAALSAPVMLAILVADIVLGITNRIAPQINVWEMGFAVRGVTGVVVVFLSLTLIADQMEKYSLGMVTEVEKVIRFLAVSG